LETRSILVINFNFQDRVQQPYTPTAQYNLFNGAIATWFSDASYGQLATYTDTTPWLTLPTGSTACNYSNWATMAQTAARQQLGIEPNNYNHVVFAFPNVPSCGWSGLGQVPGRFTWLNNAGNNHGVAVHELGHNLGLSHSHSKICFDSS